MECSRCPVAPLVHAFTSANLEQSLGRIKSKHIHAAVANLRDRMNNVCSTCSHLSKPIALKIESLRKTWNASNAELFKLVLAAEKGKEAAVSELQSAFAAVCLVCSRESNDDNPSNHGQTFFSLDSGFCSANSGKAGHPATDDNTVLSRADWIGSHRSPDYNPSAYGSDPRAALLRKEEGLDSPSSDNRNTVSALPPDIEDTLRKEFSNFASLDIIDKMLLSCVISGMNIAEFAKMLWLPHSIVNPADHTIRSITKQAAHARWTNIIRRFPIFASIASASLSPNAEARANSLHSRSRLSSDQLLDPNSHLPDNQFSNGKPTPKTRLRRQSEQAALLRRRSRQQQSDTEPSHLPSSRPRLVKPSKDSRHSSNTLTTDKPMSFSFRLRRHNPRTTSPLNTFNCIPGFESLAV